MESGLKGNRYFCPPGAIPKAGQRTWNREEDRQCMLLHNIIGISLPTSLQECISNRRRFNKVWNIHLKTGRSVEDILGL